MVKRLCIKIKNNLKDVEKVLSSDIYWLMLLNTKEYNTKPNAETKWENELNVDSSNFKKIYCLPFKTTLSTELRLFNINFYNVSFPVLNGSTS